jgi:hypothetical protein
MEKMVYKTQALNSRHIIISLIIAGVVTGGNLWIHKGDPPIGHARYTGYGISFDYDPWTQIMESDLTGHGVPSDTEGSIVAVLQSNDYLKQWGVFWVKPEVISPHMADNSESVIDFLFENAGMEGTQIVDRSEYSSTNKDEYEVSYQRFGIQEGGITIPGVIGVLYSEMQGRYVIFYLIYIADVENPEAPNEELEFMWTDVLDSIKLVEIQN